MTTEGGFRDPFALEIIKVSRWRAIAGIDMKVHYTVHDSTLAITTL